MIRLTRHLDKQCQERGVATVQECIAAVEPHVEEIRKADAWEVQVIVKMFTVMQHLSDGSNGEVVIACVDPETVTIKTVMLQRASQVRSKHASGEVFYIDGRK